MRRSADLVFGIDQYQFRKSEGAPYLTRQLCQFRCWKRLKASAPYRLKFDRENLPAGNLAICRLADHVLLGKAIFGWRGGIDQLQRISEFYNLDSNAAITNRPGFDFIGLEFIESWRRFLSAAHHHSFEPFRLSG